MHTHLAAIFAERAAPKHCQRAHVHAAMRPLSGTCADLTRQIAEYRSMIMSAELADDLPDTLRGKLEFIHQTLSAAERINGEIVRASRELTAVMAQLDRVLAEAEQTLTEWYAATETRATREEAAVVGERRRG